MSDLRTQSQALIAGVIGVPVSSEIVNISGASARTAADRPNGTVVRLLASVDCFVKMTDAAGAAAVTDMPLIGGNPEVFSIGDNTRIAAITSGAAGTLTVTVLA